MKVLIALLISITLSFGAYGLDQEQIDKVRITYNVGKSIKASDGMTFETSLSGIFGQESSWGTYIVGDKYDDSGRLKDLYESSLGGLQVKLSTAQFTIKFYPHLYKKYKHLVYEGEGIYEKFAYHKKMIAKYRKKTEGGFDKFLQEKTEASEHKKKIAYYTKVLNNPKWIERFNNEEEKAIKTFAWAERELAYHKAKLSNESAMTIIKATQEYNKLINKLNEHIDKYNEYLDDARRDTKLINALMTNHHFASEIAGHYLLWCYEDALNRGYGKSSYWRAIGRYNGGWANRTYYKKVSERMKIVRKLKKDGLI